MDVKLVVANGKNAGQAIPIAGSKFFIGRAEDCHLRPHSDLVSRHHCVILVEDGYVAVRDFGSKNGTYVNDERVELERELKTGDRLTVGQLQFEIQIGVEVGGKKKPAVHTVQEAAARTVQTSVGVEPQEDIDLSELLGDSETSPEKVAEMETRTIDSAATEKVEVAPVPKVQETKKAPPEPPTQQVEPAKTAAKAKPKPGSTKASSQNMAADALKNFFKSRR